jgi:hypothetical protein
VSFFDACCANIETCVCSLRVFANIEASVCNFFFFDEFLLQAEIDKLHADAKKEAAEEKIKIAAFVEKFKLENASPAGQVV